jgi:hypothetical protein
MTRDDEAPTRAHDLALLRRLTEAYGGDPDRWPQSAAGPQSVRRIGDDKGARRLLAEAAALDAVLSKSMLEQPMPAGLADRIASAAARMPQLRVAANVGEAQPTGPAASTSAPVDRLRSLPRSMPWVGTALAASLLVGVYLGAAGLAAPDRPRGVVVAELDTDSDFVRQGFSAPLLESLEEDAL